MPVVLVCFIVVVGGIVGCAIWQGIEHLIALTCR